MQLDFLFRSIRSFPQLHTSELLRLLSDNSGWNSSIIFQRWRCVQVGGDNVIFAPLVCKHAESAADRLSRRLWEGLVALKDNSDEFALGMTHRVAVVFDIAWSAGVNGMVAALE